MRSGRSIGAAVVAALALALAPGTAGANDLFTIEAEPTTEGHLTMDAAGNAYVGWSVDGFGTEPDIPRFCKIAPGGGCSPISLSIPGATTLSDSVSAVIPVLGPGSTVYLVAPRYAHNDLIYWTSTNGGASFDGGVKNDFYSSKTEPTDVFLNGSEFLIGAFNAGLGFSTADIGGPGGGELAFANPGGGIGGSTMGLAGPGNPVIVYWIQDDPYQLRFYRYKGAGDRSTEANWEGSSLITNGYEPDLSSGPAGLFLVSQDYAEGHYPSAINLRKYEGTSFGPPRTIVNDTASNLFVGGGIAQSPSGNRLAVVWPGRSGSANVMRLFSSTDGGTAFAESQVATIGAAYALGPNAKVAVTDSGTGWVLFRDNTGLRIADLNPIAGGPTSGGKEPPIFKGKTRAFVKKVGAFLILLRLPKSCLQDRQRFFAGVGKRKRKALSKKLGGTIRFNKVVFFYDGRKLRVKKRKPFRYLIDPGSMAPGSTHIVKARVTMTLTKGEKKRKIKRTLKGFVKAC